MRIELRQTFPHYYEILINGESRKAISQNYNETDIELKLRAEREFDSMIELCKPWSKFEEKTIKVVNV